MLDVDASRKSAGQVARQLFERRRGLKRISFEDFEEFNRSFFKPGRGQLLGVF
jgi:hypothetical protein